MSNNNYQNDLEAGLMEIAIPMPSTQHGWTYTLQQISAGMVEVISDLFNLPELDNILITPIVSKNSDVGISDTVVELYFSTKNSSNVFYRGSNKSRNNGDPINVLDYGGVTSSSNGPFGCSQHFIDSIKPLCKLGDNGKPLLKLTQQGNSREVAIVEISSDAFFMLLLKIKPNDPYCYVINYVIPVGGSSNNFSINIEKCIDASTTVNKGKKSKINYNRIAQERFQAYNSGNRHGGGRRNY